MDTNNDETPKSNNTDNITELQQSNSLPNKKRGSDALFRNRMILCTISICLMWASSLRVAAYISSFAINVPQAKILYESCKSTIQIILEEEKRFSSCVDRQMQQCEENLNAAINIETKRVDTEAMRNTAVVNRARTLSKNMTQDFSLLKRSLEEWIAKSQELPSHNNDTCSSQDREIMMSTVFDVNVLRSEALFVSEHYGRESRNAMQKIINYTKVRSEYDRDYAQKYIASVTDEVRKHAYDSPFPELQLREEFDKIQGLIDDLLVCTTLISDNNACNFPSFDVGGLSLQWEEYRQETREKWQSVEKYWVDGYDELYLEGKAYADDVFDKFYKFADFGNNAVRWWNDPPCSGGTCAQIIFEIKNSMATGMPIGLFFGGFPKSVTAAYNRFFEFDITEWEPDRDFRLVNKIKDVHLLKKVDEVYNDLIWPKVRTANVNFIAFSNSKFIEMGDIVLQVNNELREDINGIKNIVSITPLDYNPPRYVGSLSNITDLTQEKDRYDEASESLIAESAEAINIIADSKKPYNTTENLTLDALDTNYTGVKTEATRFKINFERLMAPDIDFDIWMLKFTSLADAVFIVDFVFRIYFSVRMCYRWWQVSEVKIPHVDIRTQTEIWNPFQVSNGRAIVLFFTNPMFASLLGGVLALLLITAVTTVYMPLYNEYRQGCVPLDASGTFFSKNVYSSGYNFAYRDGSSSLVKTIDTLEVQRSNTCSAMYTSSVNKQIKDSSELASDLKSIDTIGGKMRTFDKCIDIELIDEMFQTACCNQTGYTFCENGESSALDLECPLNNLQDPNTPFLPPGYFLSKHRALHNDSDEWELIDAIFECDALPKCDTTCVSPRKDRIQQTTKECSCIVEWFFHAFWLRGILSFLIFAILNITRIAFINGLARVIWKHLHPGTFTVLATCDATGNVITQNSNEDVDVHVSKNDKGNNADMPSASTRLTFSIQNKIRWNAFIFRSVGVITIFVSLALNAIWILLLRDAPDATELQWLV